MIQHWNQAIESLTIFKEKLEEFMSIVPHSPELYKQKNIIKRNWEKSQRLLNEVDKFITPPESITVKIPDEFSTEKFVDAWQYWKDYLEEQHAIKMRSRMEIKSLKHLIDISGKDPERAISYLDYAESKGSKSFYKIENIKPNKEQSHDPDFS